MGKIGKLVEVKKGGKIGKLRPINKSVCKDGGKGKSKGKTRKKKR